MNQNKLSTPIYYKIDDNMAWPDDKFFYLVAREGMFLCRNNEFFESCVPVKTGPKELASQKKFVRLSYPKIPRAILERAVGFFQLVADKQNSEAAAVFVWNRKSQEVELLIPDQTGINSAPSSYNPKGYPMDVKYQLPNLPPHQAMIGDIHCHVDGGAYASGTDTNDEKHRAGIHIVVGKIDKEPPEFHIEVVADGERFKVDKLEMVSEGYHQRRLSEVPIDWLDKVKLEEKKWSTSVYSRGEIGYGYAAKPYRDTEQADRESIQRILSGFRKNNKCPSVDEVRHKLLMETSHYTTYLECESKAKEFVKHWGKDNKKHEKQAA